MHVRICLISLDAPERFPDGTEKRVRAEERHSRTSIGTSRKRACAAP